MGFIGGFVIMGKDDMVFEGFGLNFPSVPIFSLLWPVNSKGRTAAELSCHHFTD